MKRNDWLEGWRRLWGVGLVVTSISVVCSLRCQGAADSQGTGERRLLYVAEPGIRNYLEYGGHGVLGFDIDQGHRLLKRIPTAGLDEHQAPLNVKGICASASTRRLYISTIRTLTALDLVTEKVLWEKAYEGGCDRLAITPVGKVIYVPSLE